MVWHLSDSASRVFFMGWWSPIDLNEQIPCLDAIDDFSPTFSHFFPLKSGGFFPWIPWLPWIPWIPIGHDAQDPTSREEEQNRASFRSWTDRSAQQPDRSLHQYWAPWWSGSVLPQIGMSIFSISMKLLCFFFFFGGTSIWTHIQMFSNWCINV